MEGFHEKLKTVLLLRKTFCFARSEIASCFIEVNLFFQVPPVPRDAPGGAADDPRGRAALWEAAVSPPRVGSTPCPRAVFLAALIPAETSSAFPHGLSAGGSLFTRLGYLSAGCLTAFFFLPLPL